MTMVILGKIMLETGKEGRANEKEFVVPKAMDEYLLSIKGFYRPHTGQMGLCRSSLSSNIFRCSRHALKLNHNADF